MQTPVAAQSDLDTLLTLNRDYIRSVQTSDVRRFDAIIHARTTYTLPDGGVGSGRYTDVWARRRSGWVAVSAHVTRC